MTTHAEAHAESVRIRDRERMAQNAASQELRALFRAVAARARELRVELRLSAADAARRMGVTIEQYMDTEDGSSENIGAALAALKMLELEAARRAKADAE